MDSYRDTAYGSIRRPLVSRTTWEGLTWPEFLDACQMANEYLATCWDSELYSLWEKGMSPQQAINELALTAAQYDAMGE